MQGRQEEVAGQGGISNYLYKKARMKDQAIKKQRKQWQKAYKDEMETEKAGSKNKISEMLLE